jgi:hypothetical protein
VNGALGRFIIEGHAIVSVEGAIADRGGDKPRCLNNPADWRRYQRQLDDSALVVLGRTSHRATPNPRRRRRLVLTTGVPRLAAAGPGAWLWNPAGMPAAEALAGLVPEGGRIAVVGGRGAFDHFLELGYDAFHLSRAGRCRIAGGVPVFTGVTSAQDAADRLLAFGLTLLAREVLDPAAEVVLETYRREVTADIP